MKKTIFAILIVVICLTAVYAQTSARGGRQLSATDEKTVSANLVVKVSNYSGNIIVSGWDKTTLQVFSEQPEKIRLREEGTSIIVGGARESLGDFELRVPKDATLDIETSSGSIRVTSVRGRVDIRTSSGDIDLRQVGTTVVRSNSGDIYLERINGDTSVFSKGGDLVVKQVTGDINVKMLSGDVSVSDVEGNANISAVSGDILVRGVTGNLKATSISGDVRIESVCKRVEASSASGGVSVSGSVEYLEISSASDDVSYTGTLKAGGVYRLKTVSGDAVVAVPAETTGFTVTLSSYNGEVESSFPITVVESSSSLNRKVEGRVGDGKAELYIDSFSGAAKLIKSAEKTDCKEH